VVVLKCSEEPVGYDDMDYDEQKVDDAVLGLLYMTLHDGVRAWKAFDWDALNRLHEKGYISNPVSKAKSVVLTDEGLKAAEQLFNQLFARR
jgi:hypothetical protein